MSSICENCGKEFEEEDARKEFESETESASSILQNAYALNVRLRL